MRSGSQDSARPSRASAARSRTRAASTQAPAKRSGKAPARRSGRSGKDGRRKKTSVGKKIGLGLLFAFLGLVIAGLATFLFMYASLAVPKASDLALAQKSTIYYSDGETELGSLGEVNRDIIDTTSLPEYVGEAIVASEDRTFFTNSGVDLKGILRALLTNITTGTRQGGSTLTQQYVERYYVGETTSYVGKAKEAVLALKINREQSKDEILGNYLNTIYFGRGAYGIEAASEAYFGHPASELSVSESAMLAGIIPAPSAWDPAVDAEQAKSRWERVLALMVEDGWISQSEADAATFPETIDPSTLQTEQMSGPTGYLIEQVRSELLSSGAVDEEQIANGGLKIVSTIDEERQNAAIQAAETMNAVSGWDSTTMHVALSSIDPNTGEIVAEYAGADYLERQQNAVTQDIAMAGSSFKPFALLANARDGGSVYDRYNGNSPQSFDGLSSQVSNDGGYSFGTINLVKATAYSVNTAFVGLNEEIGSANTMRAAIDAGIPESTAGLDETLLNVLGFASPHNIDLSTAYSTIANGGSRVTAHIVRSVDDSHGNRLYEAETTGERVFEAEEVSSIMPALEAVTTYGGTAESVAETVGEFTSAGKTGTSQEQLSAQFVGFVPNLVTAVSMYQSDENGNSVPLTNIGGLSQFHGGDWPVDVWNAYMSIAIQGLSETDFSWIVDSSRSSKSVTTEPAETSQSSSASTEPTEEKPGESPTGEETTTEGTDGGAGSTGGTDSGTTGGSDSTGGTGTTGGTDSGTGGTGTTGGTDSGTTGGTGTTGGSGAGSTGGAAGQ